MEPLLDAWWRARWAVVYRLPSESKLMFTALLIGGATIASFAAIALARAPSARAAFEWCANHRFLCASAAASYGLLFVLRRRANIRSEYAQSWLVATPIRASAFQQMMAMRIAASLMLQLAVVSVIVATVGDSAAMVTLLPVMAGLLLGGTVGAVWPITEHLDSRPASRILRHRRGEDHRPSLDGLSRWPIRSALAWHRPENSKFLFIVAALSVPAGSSAVLGLLILATWSVASYSFALVHSIPLVAKEAAVWLRPTTVAFGAFAWFIVRRALIHQCLGVFLLSIIAIQVGGALVEVMYFAVLWLLLFTMIAAISARQQFNRAPSLARVVGAAILVIAAESRLRGVGIAAGAAIILFHWIGSERARA